MIIAVNNVPVQSPEQLRELIGKAGKTVDVAAPRVLGRRLVRPKRAAG